MKMPGNPSRLFLIIQAIAVLGPAAALGQIESGAQGNTANEVGTSGLALILGVMSLTGVMGGYAGYLLGPPDPSELDKAKRFWVLKRSLIAGVVAAFTVPLFLSVAGAASGAQEQLVNHLTSGQGSYSSWLVLVGFCLIVSVAAPRFIAAISNKILQDLLAETKHTAAKVEATKIEVRELEEDLEQVATSTTKTLLGGTGIAERGVLEEGFDQIPTGTTMEPLSENARRVLRSAYFSDARRPSISEIVRMADLPIEDVGQALKELEAKGLVQSKDYEGTMRWRVRTVGKAFLAAEQNEAAKRREN